MKLVYSGLLEMLFMKEQQYYVLVHVCTLLIPKCQHFIGLTSSAARVLALVRRSQARRQRMASRKERRSSSDPLTAMYSQAQARWLRHTGIIRPMGGMAATHTGSERSQQ